MQWCRPVAIALIQPLARKLPWAVGLAIKRKKNAGDYYYLQSGRIKKKKKPFSLWPHSWHVEVPGPWTCTTAVTQASAVTTSDP